MTPHRTSRRVLALFIVLLPLLSRIGWPPRVEAGPLTFAVTITTDAPDATPGDGQCASTLPGGACTLRAAVQEANALPLGSTVHVTLPAGHYLLTSGELDLITNTVIISGTGAGTTRIDAGGASRILQIFPRSSVGLVLLTITGGKPTGANEQGGVILNHGSLALLGTSIQGNTATSGGGLSNGADGTVAVGGSVFSRNTSVSNGSGGGLSNDGGQMSVANSAVIRNTGGSGGGTMTMTNSSIRGNSATGYGGGLDTTGSGAMTVSNSAVISNSATTGGGGLDVGAFGMMTVTNSTVSGNSAGSQGGGLSNDFNGTMTVANSAVSGNSAGSQGGGLFNSAGVIVVTNTTINGNRAVTGAGVFSLGLCCHPSSVALAYTTVSGNMAASQGGGLDTGPGGMIIITGTILTSNTPTNCADTLPTEGQGHNLDSSASCGLAQPTDLSTTNPLLGPLQNNGGPTPTQALLPGSPAIDHGGSRATGCPATDQRGVSRPQGPACDIGAFERALSR